MGVFDQITDALSGKPQKAADPGTLNKVGYDSRPMVVPDSVRAAQRKNYDMQAAMAAHADKVHPVTPKVRP